MKKLNLRRMGSLMMIVMLLMVFLVTPAYASGPDATTPTDTTGSTGTTGSNTGTNFDTVVGPIVDLINSLLSPILAIVGAVGSLYCVVLGGKYAKAEEPQDREKAKGHLKSAIIGFVLIFVLMLALKLTMPVLQNWVANNS